MLAMITYNTCTYMYTYMYVHVHLHVKYYGQLVYMYKFLTVHWRNGSDWLWLLLISDLHAFPNTITQQHIIIIYYTHTREISCAMKSELLSRSTTSAGVVQHRVFVVAIHVAS